MQSAIQMAHCTVIKSEYIRLSLDGHLRKTDYPRFGPCLSLLPVFDSL